MTTIPFNRPTHAPATAALLNEVLESGKISGDGPFTRRASETLSHVHNGATVLLTTSCTHALEMSAILLDLQPGDEVIVPSFTFVSTANAYAIARCDPVFVDVRPDTLNLDENAIERAITPRTKAIAPVHYAGVGCNMKAIGDIAARHGLVVIEDNAHGLFGTLDDQPLGTLRSDEHAQLPRDEEPFHRRGRRARDQRSEAGRAGRDHSREGHESHAVLPGSGRQVHLGRHRIELSAE